MKLTFLKTTIFAITLILGIAACSSDPCKDKNCGTNGTCVGASDVATCNCDEGYATDANGQCNTCAPGYEGYPNCVPNPCANQDCGTYGSCTVVNGVANCECEVGYAQNAQGQCNECAEGFTGYPNCVGLNASFVGTYSVNSTCLTNSYNCFVLALTDSNNNLIGNKVTIVNLGNTPGLEVVGTCTNNTIEIDGQFTDDAGDTWDIVGTATKQGASMNLNLTMTYGISGATIVCTEVWIKQ